MLYFGLISGRETVHPGSATMYRKIRAFLSRPKVQIAALLGAVLMCALGLRLYGINWDEGWVVHPDEFNVKEVALRVHLFHPELSLNPHFFVYGSLPIYLLKGVGSILSNFNETLSTSNLIAVGRGLAAVFDTGTVLLVYLLGRRLYNHRTGLLAAIFATFTVLSIQQAHFCTVDSMLTFLVALTVLFSTKVIFDSAKPGVWTAVLIGISLGLAFATKTSALILLGVVVTAYTLRCFKGEDDSISRSSFRTSQIKSSLAGLAIVVPVALLTVAATEPYAFIDWSAFVADMRFIRDVLATRATDMPWTRQFIDTTPYWYQIRHLSIWGMGLPLAIAAWGGLLFTLATAIVRRRKSDLLLLSWVLPFFLLTGWSEVKFLRYVLPLVPFLCLFAAHLFSALCERFRGNWQRLVVACMALVVACSAFYSFAHVSIYSKRHPILRTADWVNANVGPDEIVAAEDWEFPLYLVTRPKTVLRIYDEDTPEKMATIAQQLHDADYNIVLTHRAYGTLPRLRERYPLTSRYYELLFSGELGFEMVYCATSYPSFLGITIVDDTFTRPNLPVPEGMDICSPNGIVINMGYADENHTVFDHPVTMVFEKVTDLTEEELFDLLMGNQ